MSDTFRRKVYPSIISPVPRRCSQNPLIGQKRNPFIELPPLKTPGIGEEDVIAKELHTILSKPSTILPPITKKSPSPSFFSRIDRPKINPLVFDETFIKLNSALSTCESWTEIQKL